MKHSLIMTALSILLCLLLPGCSDGYYRTPEKAYLQAYHQGNFRHEYPIDIGAEIDCISVNDSEAIWFAVVSDESIDDSIIHARMNVKGGKYRFVTAPTISYISDLENLQDRPTLKDLSYYGCVTDSDRCFYYAFVLTELLPENDGERDYTIKHHTIPVNGKDTDLTLVYYFE